MKIYKNVWVKMPVLMLTMLFVLLIARQSIAGSPKGWCYDGSSEPYPATQEVCEEKGGSYSKTKSGAIRAYKVKQKKVTKKTSQKTPSARLLQKGKKVFLVFDQPVRDVKPLRTVGGMKKVFAPKKASKSIEVTQAVKKYMAKTHKTKWNLGFSFIDASGHTHTTQAFDLSKYTKLLKQPSQTAKKKAPGAVKPDTSQHDGMSRPSGAMGTVAGRTGTKGEDQIVGPPTASTGSIREMAKDRSERKPVSGHMMAEGPRLRREPLGIETVLEGMIIEEPAAGTQVRAGNTVTIHWEYMESVWEEYHSSYPMSVDLYVRSTGDRSDIVWAFTAGSQREVDWHIPSDTPEGIYGIVARFDAGDKVYTGSTPVEVLPSGELGLIWPPMAYPGETILYVGYNYPIKWNAYGDADGQPVNIELMEDSGLFGVLASNINPPSNRWEWLLGGDCNPSATVPQGENFRIRISTAEDPSCKAQSVPITIRLPTIDINLRPRAGERWPIGETRAILWNSDHVPEGSTVKLSLLKGGSYYLLIEENQPNTGSFLWEEAGVEKYMGPVTSGSIAQAEAPPDDDYSIRIEMEACHMVYGISPVFELYR